MNTIQYGPNKGKEFPTPKSIENFNYNGFGVEIKKGFAEYEVESFIEWTNDPGIGKFKTTDGQERLIPSCQLSKEYMKTLPARPSLNPFEGNGVFFGESSNS